MSHYGVIWPGFWTGETGRAIARLGGKDAQLLAVYLMANPDDNMIGLYSIELPVVRVRVKTVTPAGIIKAFAALEQAEFADYDAATSFVWVREMAKFRLGLHDGKKLHRDDNRTIAIQRLYAALRPNPFLRPFHNRYGSEFHITRCRDFEGASDSLGSQRTDNRDQKDQHPKSKATAPDGAVRGGVC